IALVWPLQALRYRVLSLRACTSGAEGRAESGGTPLKVTVRETGRRTTAMVWNHPAIRGALSRYLDVAENQHPAKFSIAATVHRHETATNQRGGLVSGGDGIAEAKSQTSAWTCGRNCSGRGSPTDLGAAAEARVAPRRAFDRQVVVLRGVGNAEVEADDIEERHGRQSNALRAIKAGDLKNRDVAAGREGLR